MYINTHFTTAKGTLSLEHIPPDPEPAFITTNTMTDASFQQEFLEAHNAYRAKHSAPLMTMNSEMTASAQTWADHLLAISTLKHSGSQDGENIYNMWSSSTINLTGKEAVDLWYSEINEYKWSSPGYNKKTGHFTQVVWKNSSELGVGMATDGNKVFVVGQYRPAGNMKMPGYFETNVLPAGREVGGAGSTSSVGGGVSPSTSCTLL